MDEELGRDVGAIWSKARKSGSISQFLAARVALTVHCTKTLADRAYQDCCEIWDMQGLARCPAFFDAILEHCLNPLFDDAAMWAQSDPIFLKAASGRWAQYDQIFLRSGELVSSIKAVSNRLETLRKVWRIRLRVESDKQEHKQRLERQSASAKPARPAAPRKRRAADPKREAIIFGAIQAKYEGPKYCKELDDRGLKIPQRWEDCPPSYVQAYRQSPEYRKKIQDEKTRYRRKYDGMRPAERDKVIRSPRAARTRQ
jgi:hypothetical protein